MNFNTEGQLDFAGVELAWALEFGDLHAPTVLVTPRDMHSFAAHREGEVLVGVWRGCVHGGDGFTVTARWRAVGGERLAGTFEFAGNHGSEYVEAIHFPVATMPFPASVRLLVGVSQGWVYRFENSGEDRELLRHRYSSLSMTAALLGGRGLYFDHRDATRATRDYCWRQAAGRLMFSGIHPLPCAVENQAAGRLDFDNTVATFDGDWYEAAQIYREWALTTAEYCNRIRNNPKRELAIWLWNRGRGEAVAAPAEKLARDAAVPVALDWYWWHHNPYDTDYPDFWPPREGEAVFSAIVRRLREQGIYTQVYINGLAWDMDTASFADGGMDSIIVNRDGTPHAVAYNQYNMHRLGYMCGEAPRFHERLRGLVKRLAATGLPGVYCDMIGCAAIYPCYNPRHRHAPGGGDFNVRGYRELVTALRADNPGLLLSTEGCNEAYLDLFESVILLSSSMERCGTDNSIDCVPAFSAVYHGATALFGNYALPDGIPPWDELWPDADRWRSEKRWEELFPEQFYVELARTVIWGMQPTVCNLKMEHTAPTGRFAEIYRFIVAIARFYYANRDFLYDGRLLAPLTLECATTEVGFLQRGLFTTEAKSSTTVKTLPVILHSAWEAPDGRRALVMINFTARTQRYRCGTLSGTLMPREAALRQLD